MKFRFERPIMTNQQGAPEALRPIARYKIGYHTDEWGMRSSTPSGIPDPAGEWVRYEDHVAALVEAQQPAPLAAGRVKLPEPDTAETAPWTGWKVKYHSPDQIIGYGNQQFNAGRQFEVERLVALWAPQPSSAPQTDRQPAVQQWNDLIGKETHADADGLLVWRDEVDFAIPTPQADSQPAPVLPESLTLAVDRWFSENTGLGGCSDKDVSELAELFYGAAHAGGRESVDDALAIVESFGPGIGGLNDTYARQILLAEEVKRLRAARAPADSVTAPAATVIKKGADRQWMSERLGHLPDGIYSLYLAPPAQAADSVQEDAARYRLLRRGQHWSVIDGIGNDLRAEALDAAVDAARKQGEKQ